MIFEATVKEEIAQRRAHLHQRALSADHPVWAAFGDMHYRALDDMISRPLVFNPDTHSKVFERVNYDDAFPRNGSTGMVVPQYYLRCISTTRVKMIAAVDSYGKSFPGDSEWVLEIKQQLSNNDADSVSLLYAGMTIRSTPQLRAQKDLQPNKGTRMINWMGLDRTSTVTVYMIKGLNVPQNISQIDAGYIEDIWIKAIGSSGLNSANGGYFIDYVPPIHLCDLWRSIANRVEFPSHMMRTDLPCHVNKAITAHFWDYGRSLQRMAMQGIGGFPAPSDGMIQGIQPQARPATSVGGQTVSVLIGNDIPQRAIDQEAWSFFDYATRSSGAKFLRESLERLQSLAGRDPEDFELPTYIDLFAMHPKQPLLLSIMYTARYLKIVKPIMLTTMSHSVFTHFQLDTFHTAWHDTGATARFFGELESPDSYNELMGLAEISRPCTAFYKAYNKHVTNLSIVAYGPGATDYALLLPIRDPGSLKYDPRTQPLKATELFLSLCAVQVLETIVRRRLLQGETRPSEPNDLIAWLQGIRHEYGVLTEETGLKAQIDDIKGKIRKQDHCLGSERMRASAKRQPEAATALATNTIKKARIHQPFIGNTHSNERRRQLDILEAQEASRQQRGIAVAPTPCPMTTAPFSDEYRQWFMAAKAGTDMQRVAVATGNNPMAALNEEQADEYLRKRRFGQYGDNADRDKNAMQRLKDAAQQIGDEGKWCNIKKLPIRATCTACGTNFIKLHNTKHLCKELGKEVTSQQQGLHYFRILYLHDIVDGWADVDVWEELGLVAHDAATILNDQAYQERTDRMPGCLGSVYTLTGVHASNNFLLTMAIDKAIIADGPGSGDPPNEDSNDAWLYDNHQTIKALLEHYHQHGQLPLVETLCGEADTCEYYSIRAPCRKQSMYNIPLPPDVQHKHYRKNTRCIFGAVFTSFRKLPLAVRRWLWMSYRKADLLVNPTSWESNVPFAYRVG